jgi:predicted kinase
MGQQPLVVIVAGPPVSGKTTLARSLADELRLPLFSKDGFKEVLFDTLGWSYRAWSRRLGDASMRLLFAALAAELRAGRCCVVEANFSARHDTPRFLALRERFPFRAFQIQCVADGATLFERFTARAISGERHLGHVEQCQHEEQRATLLRGRSELLPLGGTLYELDTTDFGAVDTAPLLAALRAALADGSTPA